LVICGWWHYKHFIMVGKGLQGGVLKSWPHSILGDGGRRELYVGEEIGHCLRISLPNDETRKKNQRQPKFADADRNLKSMLV